MRPTLVKVPVLNEATEHYTVRKIFPVSGKWVSQDDILCEIEADKVIFEIDAECAGYAHFVVNEGDTINPGTILCILAHTPDADLAKAEVAYQHQHPEAPAAISEKQASPSSLQTLIVDGTIDQNGFLHIEQPLPVRSKQTVKVVLVYM